MHGSWIFQFSSMREIHNVSFKAEEKLLLCTVGDINAELLLLFQIIDDLIFLSYFI